jgi:hypothetical protein
MRREENELVHQNIKKKSRISKLNGLGDQLTSIEQEKTHNNHDSTRKKLS